MQKMPPVIFTGTLFGLLVLWARTYWPQPEDIHAVSWHIGEI